MTAYSRLIATYLEGHDTCVPALRRGLVDAGSERRRVDEAITVVRVLGRARLADDELVQLEAVARDLEQRGAKERRAGRVDQTVTVIVEMLCKVSQ